MPKLTMAGHCFSGYDLTVAYHTEYCGKPCRLMKTVRCAFGSKMVIDTWIEWNQNSSDQVSQTGKEVT